MTFRLSIKVNTCDQYQIWIDANTARYVPASLSVCPIHVQHLQWKDEMRPNSDYSSYVRGIRISITYHQAMIWFSQSYGQKKYQLLHEHSFQNRFRTSRLSHAIVLNTLTNWKRWTRDLQSIFYRYHIHPPSINGISNKGLVSRATGVCC